MVSENNEGGTPPTPPPVNSTPSTAEKIKKIPKRQNSTARQDLIDVVARKLVVQLNAKAEQPMEDFKSNLPKDANAIRQLPFYNTALNAIKWQRDNYLVGQVYANRNNHANNMVTLPSPPSLLHARMPLDATCLGHLQIVHLGSWFIPSKTIQESLLPIVVSLPLGSLFEPIVGTVANAIPLAQPLLDSAVKYSLIDFMQNPEWRHAIKMQTTKGLIGEKREEEERQQQRQRQHEQQ